VDNSVEPHYSSELWRVDVPTGTTGTVDVNWDQQTSQCGIIVWAVKGDHFQYDLQTDLSNSTASLSFTNVPDNSVILAGRAGTNASGLAYTWGGDVTEDIDEAIEGTHPIHSGASAEFSSGGSKTVTCTPTNASLTDGRARTFAIVLSPNQGVGNNGFYLPFSNSAELGLSAAPVSSTAATVSFATSAVSSSNASTYTFSSQSLSTAATGRIIAVLVVGERASAGARTVSSLTVAGVSAALVVRQTSDNGDAHEIWEAQVPSGTSGDIVVNFSSSMSCCGVGVYAVYNAAYQNHFTINDEGNDLSGTLVVPTNAIAIGGGTSTGNHAGTLVGLTENFDETLEGNRTQVGGLTSTDSGDGGTTIEFNPSSTHVDDTLVAATWFPADGPLNNFAAVNGPTQSTDTPTS